MAKGFTEDDYKKYVAELSKQNLTPLQFAQKVQEDTNLLESQGYTVDQALVSKYADPIIMPTLDSQVVIGSTPTSNNGITFGGTDVQTLDLTQPSDTSVTGVGFDLTQPSGTSVTGFGTGTTPRTTTGFGQPTGPTLGNYTPTLNVDATADSGINVGTPEETAGVTVDTSITQDASTLTPEQQQNVRIYAQQAANTFSAYSDPSQGAVEIQQKYIKDLAALPENLRAEAEKIFAEELETNSPEVLEQFRQAIIPTPVSEEPTVTPEEQAVLDAIEKFKTALPENMRADYQFIQDNPQRFIADGKPDVQAIADYLKGKGFTFEEAIQLTGLPADNPLYAEAQTAYGVPVDETTSTDETSTDAGVDGGITGIVPGAPQVGEANIMDYLSLQAATPQAPAGTMIAPQYDETGKQISGIQQITPTKDVEGNILEILKGLSTEDKTKLATETDAILSSEIEKVGNTIEGGKYTVPGQVTIPSSEGIATDIVTDTEFTEAGVPSGFVDPITGKFQKAENLATMTAEKSYTNIDTQARAFTGAKEKLADVNPLATVTGQLAILQEQFADGEVPVWASGAFRQVNALMAQRGIGGSTMAAEAITNALMQSAIPIAQQDASFYQNVTLQNLSNEQQAEMAKFNSRTAAIFNDQAAVNAARSLNTQSENELTQFFASLATQVSTSNAQMSNSMEQFNATAKNQMTQFFEELGLTAETFNADALNELAQFDAEQGNIIAQFNASLENQREQFNVQNQLAIDASNVQWRRDVNTANTSANNAALQFDAQNLLGIQQTALNNIWQHYDTILNYAYQSEQNEIDRAYQLMLTSMSQEFQRSVQEDSDLMGLVSSGIKSAAIIASSKSGRDWVSDVLPG